MRRSLAVAAGLSICFALAPAALLAADWEAKIECQGVPQKMVAGRNVFLFCSVTNLGTQTWKTAELIRLGYFWKLGSSPDTDGFGRTDFTSDIPPGGFVNPAPLGLKLIVQVPQTPGQYLLRLDLVKENGFWFSGFFGLLPPSGQTAAGKSADFPVEVVPAQTGRIRVPLIVSPTPPFAGCPTKIKVSTEGSCGGLSLDFGDGTPPGKLSGEGPTFDHVYAKPGPVTLKATPGTDCIGSAETALTVRPAPEVCGLCDALSCAAPPAAKPVIHGASAFATPDNHVWIVGEGFGDVPGKIILHGPGGSWSKELVLEPDLKWHDNSVIGRVPGDISGLMDQAAFLQVQRQSDSQKSGDWDIAFHAKQVTVEIPPGAVEVVACSDATAVGSCNSVVVDTGGPFFTGPAETSINGYHLCTNLACIVHSGDGGFDRYRLTLKNGWVVSEATLETYMGKAPVLSGFSANQPTSIDGTVKWQVDCREAVLYSIRIRATGPVGVAFQ